MQLTCWREVHNDRHSWLERRALLRFVVSGALAIISLLSAGLPQTLATPAPIDGDYNAIGVSGVFNGNVMTGCSYDPLTRNGKRVVTDLVVPGSQLRKLRKATKRKATGSELSIDTKRAVRYSLGQWLGPCALSIRARFIIC
jgi:hypothetical protein